MEAIPCYWALIIPPEIRKLKVSLMFLGNIEREKWHEIGEQLHAIL